MRTRTGPVIFCDFDGTITTTDVTDLLLSQLAHPSWLEVEQEWVRGLIGSRECLERQMALAQATAKELNALIDSIPIDPSFPSFYGFARRHRIRLVVVSDGFDYVIRRVFKRAGIEASFRNGGTLFASSLRVVGRRLLTAFPHSGGCPHGCGTCKAALLRRLGQGHAPVVYIGDGLSDRFAVEEATLVFAKRQLAAYCRERGFAFYPFEEFADIERAVFSRFSLEKSLLPESSQRVLTTSEL